jgi:small-conductance mechanosensitive channel
MQYLNLAIGIILVVLIFLSVHFSIADKILEEWAEVENKVAVFLIAGVCVAIVLFALIWNLMRFV